MRKFQYILLSVCAVIGLSACQNGMNESSQTKNALQSAPQHEIVADLSGWRLAKIQNDPDGYLKWYVPTYNSPNQEKVLLNYGKGITTSLDNSLQDVVRGEQTLPCTFDYKILSRTADSMVFMTNLSNCRSGPPALMTVRKIFNADDGQYSIMYSIIPSASNKNKINRMEKVITNAYLK